MTNMSRTESAIITQNWSAAEIIVSSCILLVVDIFAICGNILVIFVILRTKELRGRESNWFVVNLAVADLLVSLTVIPTSVDTLINGNFRLGITFKEFVGFTNFVFCICSIMNLQLLSFDRWFAISKPFKYLELVTPKKTGIVCASVWIYAILCALPPTFGVSSYFCFIPNIDYCNLEDDWSGSHEALLFAGAVLGLTYLLSLTVMAISYWKIFRITRSHVRRIALERTPNSCYSKTEAENQLEMEVAHGTSSDHRENSTASSTRSLYGGFVRASDVKTAKSFLIVIGVYFICWTPFCVTLVIDIILDTKLNPKASLACLWIGYTNSCLNPLIYTWKYKQFRESLVAICKKYYRRLTGKF